MPRSVRSANIAVFVNRPPHFDPRSYCLPAVPGPMFAFRCLSSLPRQLCAANAVSVQRLVVIHCDSHLDELPCELEGALVVGDRRAAIPSDIEARPHANVKQPPPPPQ